MILVTKIRALLPKCSRMVDAADGEPVICEEVAGELGLLGKRWEVVVSDSGEYELVNLGEVLCGEVEECNCPPTDACEVCAPDAYRLFGPQFRDKGELIEDRYLRMAEWFAEEAIGARVRFSFVEVR